ncbi:TetR/AcrR family transcriptional regulator [Burkholderia sp. USMB20]|uniref:TetR/AcrR family transcriptional regulator n=1 Tax=Burkholderia sp. USMB20 TaxID=1571773 RepID=UPI0005E2DC68|nr:TetR/AcrR family transcriptional regulator [Burkholderia sp. USMB20]TGN95733.1 TetR family transcriptional regulator [Burkholderia sp. USMB20]
MDKITIASEDMSGTREKPRPRKRGNRASRVPEILEASMHVLTSEGYAKYSVNRVAAETGILLSTLQHYFPSREHLLRETIREYVSRYVGRYRMVASNKLLSPHQRLDAIVDSFVDDFGESDAAGFVLEVWALAEHEPFAAELVSATNGQFRQMFDQIVNEASPFLSTEERAVRSALLTAHADGLVLFLRRSGDEAPQLSAIRQGIKVVWRALANG